MLFSIIVPIYNTEKYLKACLDSIAAQDFDDFEVILVDDGSTDGSPRICDEFCMDFNKRAGRNAGAKVIHQENRGLSGARNRGIEEATGEWLWFIDSDDFIVPDALAVFKERMRFSQGDMYAFQYIKTDENGENPEYIFFRENQELIRIKNEGDLIWNYENRFFNYKDGWEAPFRLFKREIIERYGLKFKDTKTVFAEDICFTAEYMMCISSMVMLVNYLYYYRYRHTSIMHSLNQRTVIPRLINMLEDTYIECVRYKKKQIKKEFEKICFALLKDHIRIKLDELNDSEICSEIAEGTKNRTIGRYIKKVSDKLISEAKGDRRRK